MTKARFSILFLCAIAFASLLQAAKPRRWMVSSANDFLAGDFEGTSLSSDGRIFLAPGQEMVLDTDQPLIHAAVADKSGNLFVATGNEGKIFRLPRRGDGEEWADLEEKGVFALAVDSSNRLYAGVSPGGKVYRIAGKGQVEAFFDSGAKFLWDLVFDERDNLYVATGPKGQVFQVDPQGKRDLYYDSAETHVISLARDLEGRLVAGTAPGGQLIRIDRKGAGFVLFDSSMEEVRGIVSDRYGNLYAAGLSFQDGKTPASKPAAPAPEKKGADSNGDEEETITVASGRKGKRLEVYRHSRSGLIETIYSADDELAFDLLVRDDGTVLVATNQKGRVLALTPDRLVRLVAQTPNDQATVLVDVEGTLYAATSNLGKVYRLGVSPGDRGVYESKALDAGMPAQWGKIRWSVDSPRDTLPRFRTRSGNTEKPDSTWSDWSEPLSEAGGAQIASPSARFLQWKVEFSRAAGDNALLGQANAIRWVEINYQQRNVAPLVQELTIQPPGTSLVKLPVAANPASVALGGPDDAHLYALPDVVRKLGLPTVTPPPQKIFIPGARSITWSAKDENDDDLVYSLFLKQADEKEWKLLAADRTDSFFTMDGASFPAGRYQVRVVASDHLSNPPASALKGDLISPPFVLSNDPPRLETDAPQTGAKKAEIRFRAKTQVSSIYQAEYSLDGGPWSIVSPEDGIADSPEESFLLELDDLSAGEHIVVLRIVDSVGNLGTGRVMLRVP